MTRPTVTPPPSEPVALTDADALDFLDRHEVALLAFLAPDDGPSDRLRPRLALAAAKMGEPRLGVGVLDVDRHPLVADAVGVKSAPTTLVFVRGEVTDRLVGAVPQDVLEAT
ncbi:MAG: thioredoxin family protein, partial [Vicinamibacteria bacterium]